MTADKLQLQDKKQKPNIMDWQMDRQMNIWMDK